MLCGVLFPSQNIYFGLMLTAQTLRAPHRAAHLFGPRIDLARQNCLMKKTKKKTNPILCVAPLAVFLLLLRLRPKVIRSGTCSRQSYVGHAAQKVANQATEQSEKKKREKVAKLYEQQRSRKSLINQMSNIKLSCQFIPNFLWKCSALIDYLNGRATKPNMVLFDKQPIYVCL